MVDYDDLPLFPLSVVLFPEMPLPLHIFEPRYQELVRHCTENDAPFGIVCVREDTNRHGESGIYSVGTTARITQYEPLEGGESNILVMGETRFRLRDTYTLHPYLSGRAEPFWEQTADPLELQSPFDRAGSLFKAYLKSLFALSGRAVSGIQLPTEAEALSFAVASVLQVPLSDKQTLLEMNDTKSRLVREAELLSREIDAHKLLRVAQEELSLSEGATVRPVDTQALGRLSSRN